MNNVWAFLGISEAHQKVGSMQIAVYTDPVLSAGGSNLTDPIAWICLLTQAGLLSGLLFWPRSPLYIAPAQMLEPGNGAISVANSETPAASSGQPRPDPL